MAAKGNGVKRKRCFVVGPIGDDDSDDRIHADWLLEEIIQPVFDNKYPDFDVVRADKISIPGRIDAQVITELLEAELVIADLTTLNPNAFYEIGIRHVVRKPIIHMHLEGQRIPFDIASFRSIKFQTKRPSDLKKARVSLESALNSALDPAHEVDNPVTFSRGKVEFDKTATPAEKVMQERLDEVVYRLASLESNVSPSVNRLTNVIPRATQRRMVEKFPKNAGKFLAVEISATGTQSPKIVFDDVMQFSEKFFPSEHVEIMHENEYSVTLRLIATARNFDAANMLMQEITPLGYRVEISASE